MICAHGADASAVPCPHRTLPKTDSDAVRRARLLLGDVQRTDAQLAGMDYPGHHLVRRASTRTGTGGNTDKSFPAVVLAGVIAPDLHAGEAATRRASRPRQVCGLIADGLTW